MWDNNPDIDKKYSLSLNVVKKTDANRVKTGYHEADPYDVYRHCFSDCDLFNKEYLFSLISPIIQHHLIFPRG